EVTFTRDVAPILYKNCVECHRPGDIAPMSLLTYKDARPWARSIRQEVVTREMPPWHADPHYGPFANNRSLSQKDVETIAAWVDQGAKEGREGDLPAVPSFVNGWLIGQPDVVLTMPQAYDIPANGPDEYIYFTIPTNFKQDVWVQAAEVRPGNKKVVHHVIAFVQPPEVAAISKMSGGGDMEEGAFGTGGKSIFYKDGKLIRVKMDAPVQDDGCKLPNGGSFFGTSDEDGFGGISLLAGYAPGKDVDQWPAGTAKKIPAGSNIVLQIHYSNFRGAENKPETDQTSVGLIFAKVPPKKMIVTMGVENDYFQLPAGDPNHQVSACYMLKNDVQVIDYMPHMHLRGKDMRYDVTYPDGRQATLFEVPKFSFNWQTMYHLKEPLTLPKGTKVLVTAHFDNSEGNKYNPDPRKVVRFGDPTYDEMMIGWIEYAVDVPKERAVAAVDPAIYDQYAGTYQFTAKIALTIRRDGSRLLGQAPGTPELEFFPESETKFFLRAIKADLTFVKNGKSEVTEAVFTMNGFAMHGKRVMPAVAGAGRSK
ncbi:MAG TPA: DUF3471 domain-containing protein, partial [Blastocatellia bacterium]|nr:DUF3471 domain-containing protein [Blastocatellia bacterium]